jgi:RNA polymerase sigma factor (sigma-70 family)
MVESLTDQELHQRYVGGDMAAGSAIVARYLEPITGYFKRRLPAEADDLAQETLLVYVERPERCAQGKLRAFLFGVAHNKLLKKYRWKGRHPEDELPALSLLGAADPGLSSVVGGREEIRRLVAAFAKLPADQAAVIELLLVGLTIEEIAAALEQNVNTCKGWKRKGIERLRQEISELRIPVREAMAALYELGLMDRPNVRRLFEDLAEGGAAEDDEV